MTDSSMWVIIAVVLVILFFIVVIIGVGLTIFFIARKRSKARTPAAAAFSAEPGYAPQRLPQPEAQPISPSMEVAPPAVESPLPSPEPASEGPVTYDSGTADFDPSRTVAITRENTVTISYGTIKFVSGVLAGQEFKVVPEGEYIGRETSLAQIIVSDPRISKRHLWIGVREGVVRIEDQNSRNGTFLNDPRSERITEVTLTPGDTVILGESDVARFEYQA